MDTMHKLFEIAGELKKVSVEFSRLNWAYYTTGYDFGIQAKYSEMTDILKRKDYFDMICKAKDEAKDPLSKRRAELMFKSFEPFHLSDEMNKLDADIRKITNRLSGILNRHRSNIDGTDVTSLRITEILSEDSDRENRKKAYYSRNQVNKPLLEGGFIELVNLRKEYAKLAGAKDFVEYRLEKDGLTPDIFNGWEKTVQDFAPRMKETHAKFAAKYLNDDVVYPWDEAYISGRIAPVTNKVVPMTDYFKYVNGLFSMFGFNISKYNITYDLFSRNNKSEWGYNFPVETAKDSRILANIKDRFHEFGVLLHETGHALHSFLNDPEKIILNQGISGIISEGIANLFGSFLSKPVFYRQFFEDDRQDADAQFSALTEWRKANVFRPVGNIFFDQELYRNEIRSAQDIHSLKAEIERGLYGFEPGDEEPVWGYRIHHTTHPIYLHNYFMGDVTCEMLKKVFTQKEGVKEITDRPEAFGAFLTENVIAPSGSYPYPELFKRIAGEEFSLSFIME